MGWKPNSGVASSRQQGQRERIALFCVFFPIFASQFTRNQFDMYSFVSQSWCAFWQKDDMLLKWSILKSTSEPNHKGMHIISRTQRFYVNFKSSLYLILWYAFMNRLTVLAGKPYHSFVKKQSWLADKRIHIKLVSSDFSSFFFFFFFFFKIFDFPIFSDL